MRLQVEEQDQDARIVSRDGETVVIMKAGLLSPRAERVIAQVLLLLDDPGDVAVYPTEVGVGDSINEPT